MQLQTLFLQAILLIVVVHAVANPAPTGTVAGPVLPPAASPPTAGIPSLTSSSTAELSVGNVAFNTWDRTRAAQSDKYKKTNELEATTQKLREEVRSLTTERDRTLHYVFLFALPQPRSIECAAGLFLVCFSSKKRYADDSLFLVC